MKKKGRAGAIFWGVILTLNLLGAAACKFFPALRPEGMTQDGIDIVWAILIVGCALYVLLEGRLYADD